jgi:hypothetical protein
MVIHEALSEGQPWQDPSPLELSKKFPALVSTPKNLSMSRGAPPGVGSSAQSPARKLSQHPVSNRLARREQGYEGGWSSERESGLTKGGDNYARNGGDGYGMRNSSSYSPSSGYDGGRQMSSVSSNSLGSSGGRISRPQGTGGNTNGDYEDDWGSLLSTGWEALSSIAVTATQTVADVAQNVCSLVLSSEAYQG